MGREVILLAEHDLEATPRGIPCDTGPVDAAADDEHIGVLRRRREVILHPEHLAMRP
jgi:hypothetical protein